MARNITIGAAQLGPIQKSHSREEVVVRLIALLRQAHGAGCDVVVFPELALTTFFPRWFVDDITEADHWYETEMPSAATQPLFDEAKKLGIGFCLGYAELTSDGHRFNTQVLVEKDGTIVAKYRKVHIPGHEHNEPDRPFQHAERRGVERFRCASRNDDLQRSSLARDISSDGLTRCGTHLVWLQHSNPLRS
jgi:predicted amidohydrolase